MQHLIERLYKYSEYRASDKDNSISATTIIGSLYKGSLALAGTEKDEDLIKIELKRSSMIGTAVHKWAERALDNDPTIVQERYLEREINLDGKTYVISGSCDLLEQQANLTWTIADWKTGYGKIRNTDMLAKDMKQMSIYRWLFNDEYNINDTGYSLFISQSNNVQDAYPVNLMSLDATEDYIESRLFAIETNERVDCNENVKYNRCLYCSFLCDERKV